MAPQHSGAIVAHVGDLNFSTNVVGGSPESSFRLSVPALALLAHDDLLTGDPDSEIAGPHLGVAYWKVRP